MLGRHVGSDGLFMGNFVSTRGARPGEWGGGGGFRSSKELRSKEGWQLCCEGRLGLRAGTPKAPLTRLL